MGNAKARGNYDERKAQAMARGASKMREPLRAKPQIIGGIVRTFRTVKADDGSKETRLFERRQQNGIAVSMDGRTRYRYDGVCVRRMKEGEGHEAQ